MEDQKQQTSGLSSRIRTKPNNTKPQNDQDLNEKKYTFYLDVTFPGKIQVPSTEVVVPITMKVDEAVNLALIKFKLQLESLGIIVDNNPKLYNPRLAKKSGKAKTDMPSLDGDQILSQIKINAVSLQVKEEKAVTLVAETPPKPTLSSPPAVIPQNKVAQTIEKQINVQKKQGREIMQQMVQKPSKPQSKCFFSLC